MGYAVELSFLILRQSYLGLQLSPLFALVSKVIHESNNFKLVKLKMSSIPSKEEREPFTFLLRNASYKHEPKMNSKEVPMKDMTISFNFNDRILCYKFYTKY